MRWLIVSFLVSLFSVATWSYEGCTVSFGKRSCQHRMLEGVIVVCDGHGTETQVPRNLPQDTLYLSLGNFNFSRTLVSSDFSRLTTVQCLAIVHSRLAGLRNDTFSQFEALHELSLDGTRLNESHLGFLAHANFRPELFAVSKSPHLTTLEDYGSPKTLQTLKTLRLDHNRLKSLSVGFFAELKNLEILDLSHNHLTTLPWEIFNHLGKLNQLYLAGNHLQAIPDSMRSVFFAVKHLSLAANPLHCNCRLRWLKDFYQRDATDKHVDADRVYCRGPKHTLVALAPPAPENFHCSQPDTPIISWRENEDGRIEMNCTARGDPGPTLTVIVLEDRMKIVIPASENMAQLNTSTPQMLVAPGRVSCEAANSEGVRRHIEHVGPKLDVESNSFRFAASLLTLLLCTIASAGHEIIL